MTFDHFVGQVQHRAQLAATDEALCAVRCTFETLAERLSYDEAKDLGAQLPRELAVHLAVPEHSVRMSLEDFFRRVSEREQVDLPKAIHHARVVVEVLEEAVSGGEIKHVRGQLPHDWDALFESGSQGHLTTKHEPAAAPV
jgi:uncharacterized protein (DUF2267 family)